MNAPISLSISALGSGVESPLHAFQSNQTVPITFWCVAARAGSPAPAFGKFSTNGPSGDDLTDVENTYQFVTGHTWDVQEDGPREYSQTDTVDPDTMEALSATPGTNTYPAGFWDPTIWNNQIGYLYNMPPIVLDFTSSGSPDWDKGPTRTGIVAALDGVNWTNLWASDPSEPNNFQYDRVALSGSDSGELPFGGTASGDLISNRVPIGPRLTLTGATGEVSNFFTGGFHGLSDGAGLFLQRIQVQIRNFHGDPIPYFIYEQVGAASAVHINSNSTLDASLTGTGLYTRKVSTGVWNHDLQIIQLPEARLDSPFRITTIAGEKVGAGSLISMVVGMTFEEYMLQTLGPTWADYLFT